MKIEINNLVLERPGGILAINRLSFCFDTGKCSSVAVLGANGAGKSTLLESIPGLIPIRSGAITVDGLRVEKRNLTAIRTKVGMIFQNPDDQLFCHTVAEDVGFGPHSLRLDPAEQQTRVHAAMERMGILHIAQRDTTHLSGGEKRRAALAGVLAMKPEAILLDEPTSMLDPRSSRELAELLNSMDKTLKIVATHDLAFAERVCQECIVLKDGQICAAGKSAEILRNHELLFGCGLE